MAWSETKDIGHEAAGENSQAQLTFCKKTKSAKSTLNVIVEPKETDYEQGSADVAKSLADWQLHKKLTLKWQLRKVPMSFNHSESFDLSNKSDEDIAVVHHWIKGVGNRCAEVRIWAEDNLCSSCLLIQEKKITKIQSISTTLHHVSHDTCKMHGRDIKIRYFGSILILESEKD